MPGIFNVPKSGLENVSLDEVLATAKAAGHEQGREDGAARVIERLRRLAPPRWASAFENILTTDERLTAAERVTALLEQIPNDRTRRRVLNQVRRELRREEYAKGKEKAKLGVELDHLRRLEAVGTELFPWLKQDLKLERPFSSNLHKFLDALDARNVLDFGDTAAVMSGELTTQWADLAGGASVFLVEHHWSAAFTNATDYDRGEIRLPDEVCAFEFRISGRPVIAFALEVDGVLTYQCATLSQDTWVLINVMRAGDKLENKMVAIVEAEIRAVAVALDAEIAIADVVRAPHRLNRARERRGRAPLCSYHVVSLARRTRAPALEREGDIEPGTHKRLHFRRGHWRHYPDHKTWINWMLVGDPELGWIEKHYRL